MDANVMAVQENLNMCYSKILLQSDIGDNNISADLSAPLLLKVPEKWISAKPRVLIIGQETLDWNFVKGDYPRHESIFNDIADWKEFKEKPDSVPALVEGYRFFNFSKTHSVNHRAPFFSAYRRIREAVGDDLDSFDTSVLWTNLIRMAYDGGSILQINNISIRNRLFDISGEVLRCEIRALSPDAIIFFTGPRYDDALKRAFQDVKFNKIAEYDWQTFSSMQSSMLPEYSWRTYHPAYLRRSKQEFILGELCNTLASFTHAAKPLDDADQLAAG
jgi:hypothetical protein